MLCSTVEHVYNWQKLQTIAGGWNPLKGQRKLSEVAQIARVIWRRTARLKTMSPFKRHRQCRKQGRASNCPIWNKWCVSAKYVHTACSRTDMCSLEVAKSGDFEDPSAYNSELVGLSCDGDTRNVRWKGELWTGPPEKKAIAMKQCWGCRLAGADWS